MVERRALAARLAVRDPRLLMDYLGWYVSDRVGKAGRRVGRGPIPEALTPSEARRHIAGIVGDWEEGPALTRVRTCTPAAVKGAGDAARLAGDRSLGELVYGLVRALRPAVVVETGVATGVTSAYALAGLADNRGGELLSVDLPPTRLLTAGLVGAAVPAELRGRWTYELGSARRLLPEILRRTRGAMRIFLHDSDHSYSNMRWELERAWEALAPGGWIVADDVDLHTAFRDVAAAAAAQPLYVAQAAKPGCTGLLRLA
jgi:predicted O-methyltransferase YrrM